MNDEQNPTPDIVEGGRSSGRSWVVGVLAAFTLLGLIALGGIQHYRDRANDEVGEALSKKYGVEVVRLDDFRRPGEPITWRVDGTERECILSAEADVLMCDAADEPREFFEVGADRDEGNW